MALCRTSHAVCKRKQHDERHLHSQIATTATWDNEDMKTKTKRKKGYVLNTSKRIENENNRTKRTEKHLNVHSLLCVGRLHRSTLPIITRFPAWGFYSIFKLFTWSCIFLANIGILKYFIRSESNRTAPDVGLWNALYRKRKIRHYILFFSNDNKHDSQSSLFIQWIIFDHWSRTGAEDKNLTFILI